MNKVEKIHIGKAKGVYTTEDDRYLILSFKDDATAANGLKRGSIRSKGIFNNRISNILMRLLEKNGIPTHYVSELSERDTLIRKLSMIRLETVVRNRVAGSLARRLRMTEGTVLASPVLELNYLNEAMGDPMVNETHILAMGLATSDEIRTMEEMSLRINRILTDYFSGMGIDLIDFKLEFGRDEEGRIVLADEISPDTCRFWDSRTHERLDKDRFRNDLGEVAEGYREVYERVTAEENNRG